MAIDGDRQLQELRELQIETVAPAGAETVDHTHLFRERSLRAAEFPTIHGPIIDRDPIVVKLVASPPDRLANA